MNTLFFKTIALGSMAAGALLLSGCGKDAGTEEIAITEATAKSEFTIPDSPEAAIKTILSEFAKGDSGIVWEALPTSYQSDVNGLVQLAGSKVDQEVYDESFSLLARLADVVDQQESFIVNSSLLKDKPVDEVAQLEATLPSVVGLLNTITSSELSSVNGLLNFDGQTFFDTTVSKCIEYVEAIGKLTGNETKLAEFTSIVVTLVDSGEEEATLSLTMPGEEAEEIVVAKVENRWVPLEMKKDWETNFKEMTTSLENYSAEAFEAQKPQVMSALTMVDGILTKIASAETQEQFDQSLREATMPFMNIVMMLNQAAQGTN